MLKEKIFINDRNTLFLLVIFFFSRLVYFYLGIRYEIFLSAWQFFPIEFYKYDLLNSLFYNFSQPPLLNFLIGLSLKLAGNNFIYILHITFLITSFFLFLYLFKILILLNFKNSFSLIFVIILMIWPTTILLENHGYKDFLVLAFVIFSIYFSIKIIKNKKILNYFFLGIHISILCLLRETFHIFWCYIFFLFIYLLNKDKKILLSTFLVTFFVLSFYLKNLIVFNSFQLGGWMYENLSQKAQFIVRFQKQDQWLKNIIFNSDEDYLKFTKTLSPIWNKAIFTSAFEYKNFLNYNYKYSYSLLHTNTFHNEVMLEVDKIRKSDFYKYLFNYPEIFVFSSMNAFTRHFFNSTDSFLFFQNNSKKIPKLIKISDCFKLTLRCIYEKKISNAYHTLTNYEKIWFSLNQINFLFVIIYLLLLYFAIRNIFNFKMLNSKHKIITFWMVTFIFNLLILILFEDTEIPRHRFPFDYVAIVFILFARSYYLNKKNKL